MLIHFYKSTLGKGKFTSSAQIGIEVAVKQLPSSKGKDLVRKDLVIWEKGNQTVWNEDLKAVNDPVSILEWKVNSESKCKVDVEWLMEFTKTYPRVLGYSVCAFIKDKRGISYKRIENGKVVS